MLISRRSSIRIFFGAGLAGSAWTRHLFAAPAPFSPAPALFEVDRLTAGFDTRGTSTSKRHYRASATITLLSVPVFNRNDVGSGFTVIEDRADTRGSSVAITFGAGSWPETAHGLNRLGYIQEVVLENRPGDVAECAYFAFMTSSQEKNLDQARKALETTSGEIPYAAAEGIGKDGAFNSRLDRIAFPAKLTWRDYPELIDKVRAAVSSEEPTERKQKRYSAGDAAPATFLYAVRTALQSAQTKTSGTLIYNGKEFGLRTEKEADPAMGEKFATRSLVKDAASVVRLSATLHDTVTGVVTPFRLWFARGEESMPPLRFEYQARSFLRLAFEFDPLANAPVRKETA